MTGAAPPPLRLLRLDELDMGPDYLIVRPSSPGLLTIGVLCLVLAGLIVRDAARGGMHWGWAAPLILVLCFLAWKAYRGWQRFRRAGAWLLAVGPDRVLIRFRSVVSQHLPAELPQVIELPLSQLASVRITHRRVEGSSDDGRSRTSYDYLDLRARGADLRPLQAELLQDQRERSRQWFAQRDPSVAVTRDGVLRVEMAYAGSSAAPDARAVVRLLTPRVPVEDEVWEHIDLTTTASLSAAEQDAAIRAIGESSTRRAQALAARYFPDAPEKDAAAYVQHLLDVRSPDSEEQPPAPAPPADAAVLPAPRLLSHADARPAAGDALVRPRSTGTLVYGVVFIALAGFIGWKGYTGDLRWWLALLLGGLFALMGWGGLETWSKTLRRDAWLMAIGGTRVLIRFRSFMHDHFPAADPVVVELPWAHVVSVRQTKQKVARPATNGSTPAFRYRTFLDLRTRGLNLGPLWEALARERTLRHGGIRRDHNPVVLPGDDVVRVEMFSRHGGTRPSIERVLGLLGRHVVVEEAVSEEVDATGTPALPPAENEAAVRALARSGQTLAAIRLARTCYGEGLVQATERVERLAESAAEVQKN